jgi:DNA-3-methyladenine glycosylase
VTVVPPGDPLPREFFAHGSVEVAPLLLGKVFVVGDVAGRVVEVEAYRSDDPASHSFRGERARNRSMFGEPGHLYVYLSYGIHYCVNVVCGRAGDAQAVLLRAVVPLVGLEQMRARRGRVRDADLTNGPGKIGQAFGLDLSFDGVDVVSGTSSVRVLDDGVPPPSDPLVTPRVGISVALDRHWRWCAPGHEGRRR